MTNAIILRNDETALSTDLANPIDLAIAGWLHTKSSRSGSAKTAKAYEDTLTAFRRALREAGLDLDSNTRTVALAAQGWAGNSTKGRDVSASTYNQRLAILSSFYGYANKNELLDGNPISRVERRKAQGYAHASALDYDDLKKRLGKIDRDTLAGKRDYALLSVALQTGRRLSELAALRRGDILFNDGKALITWQRAKGGKVMSDRLPTSVTNALVDYLLTAELLNAAPESPVWISVSRLNPGQAISIQTIADMCEKHLGTSKVHSLRHTFARLMEDSGAKVSDIQARLGHESLATTGRYLAALKRADNEQADAIAMRLGLGDDAPPSTPTVAPIKPPAKTRKAKRVTQQSPTLPTAPTPEASADQSTDDLRALDDLLASTDALLAEMHAIDPDTLNFDPSLLPTVTIHLDHDARQALRSAAADPKGTIWRDARTRAGVRYLLDLGMLINVKGTPTRVYYTITDAGRDLAAQLPTPDEEWANIYVDISDPAYLDHRTYTIRWAGKLPETDRERRKRRNENDVREWEAKVKERQALKDHDLAWLVKDIQDKELSPDLFDGMAVPHSVEMIYKACAIEYERRHGQPWNWGAAIEWRQGHGFYAMPGDTFLGSHRKKALTAICGYVNTGRDNQAARRDGRKAGKS